MRGKLSSHSAARIFKVNLKCQSIRTDVIALNVHIFVVISLPLML